MQAADELWSNSRHTDCGICVLSARGCSPCCAEHHSSNICINTEHTAQSREKQISPKEALPKEFPRFRKLEERGGEKRK